MIRRAIVLVLALAFLSVACGKDDGKKSKKADKITVTKESVLPASKTRELLTGNTLHAQRPGKERSLKLYHGKNGVAQSYDDKEKKGKWRVTDDGQYCLEWEGKPEHCRYLASDGKGGVVVVSKELTVFWVVDKIKPGKPDKK